MRANFDKDTNYPWSIVPQIEGDDASYQIRNNIEKDKSVNIPFKTYDEADNYIQTHLK